MAIALELEATRRQNPHPHEPEAGNGLVSPMTQSTPSQLRPEHPRQCIGACPCPGLPCITILFHIWAVSGVPLMYTQADTCTDLFAVLA